MGAGKSTLFRVEVPVEDRLGMITTDGPALAIGNVDPEGPMAAAGITKGDRIMSVDGHEIHELARPVAAKVLKEALESSATNLLTLVVARRCPPDRIPPSATLLYADGTDDSNRESARNARTLSDNGGDEAISAQSIGVSRSKYTWDRAGESAYNQLLKRKEELKEVDLADDEDARAEWFALIAALDKQVPERARARSREDFDALQRAATAKTSTLVNDNPTSKPQKTQILSKKKKSSRRAEVTEEPVSKSVASSDPVASISSVEGDDTEPELSFAIMTPPVRMAAPTTAKEAYERIMADESTVSWLRGLFSNPRPDCDPQRAVWTFLKMEAGVPTTMAAEVLAMIERHPLTGSAVATTSLPLLPPTTSSLAENVDEQPTVDVASGFEGLQPVENPSTSTEISQDPIANNGDSSGSTEAIENPSGEVLDEELNPIDPPATEISSECTDGREPQKAAPNNDSPSIEVSPLPVTDKKTSQPYSNILESKAALADLTDETTIVASQEDTQPKPKPCPTGCTCLLCKVTEAEFEGEILQEVPLCTCGSPMELSNYKKMSYKTGWFCDDCPTRGKRKGTRWFCFKCRHDLCKECAVNHYPINLARDAKRRELTEVLVGRTSSQSSDVGTATTSESMPQHEAQLTHPNPISSTTTVSEDALAAVMALEVSVSESSSTQPQSENATTPVAVTSYIDEKAEEREERRANENKSAHIMNEASALLDRAVALSPTQAAIPVEGEPEAVAVQLAATQTTLRAARLKRSASQLLEQLNKALDEAA